MKSFDYDNLYRKFLEEINELNSIEWNQLAGDLGVKKDEKEKAAQQLALFELREK